MEGVLFRAHQPTCFAGLLLFRFLIRVFLLLLLLRFVLASEYRVTVTRSVVSRSSVSFRVTCVEVIVVEGEYVRGTERLAILVTIRILLQLAHLVLEVLPA